MALALKIAGGPTASAGMWPPRAEPQTEAKKVKKTKWHTNTWPKHGQNQKNPT
jgi:hypothetical protein